MKLKTLKDLKSAIRGLVYRKEMREEAIKWIKRARDYERGNTADAIDFMEFFNITEKDIRETQSSGNASGVNK